MLNCLGTVRGRRDLEIHVPFMGLYHIANANKFVVASLFTSWVRPKFLSFVSGNLLIILHDN